VIAWSKRMIFFSTNSNSSSSSFRRIVAYQRTCQLSATPETRRCLEVAANTAATGSRSRGHFDCRRCF
jgi:hypothetical protein